MTSTEMIKDMVERQKAYDAEVFKKHKITSVSRQQLECALFDELGELMHAQKGHWCWWKFTQEPVDVAKVIEEYVDVLHFALMFEITYGDCRYQNEEDNFKKEQEELEKKLRKKANASLRKMKRMVQIKKETDEFVKKLKEKENE